MPRHAPQLARPARSRRPLLAGVSLLAGGGAATLAFETSVELGLFFAAQVVLLLVLLARSLGRGATAQRDSARA